MVKKEMHFHSQSVGQGMDSNETAWLKKEMQCAHPLLPMG